jgi:hypothetical protein
MKDQLLLVLCGLALAVPIYGVIYWVGKAKKYLRQLIVSLNSLNRVADSNQKLVQIGSQVAMELQMLRSVVAGNAVVPGGGEQAGTEPTGEVRGRGPRPQYPPPIMDLYRDVPDAKIEDTVIEETDDADMAAQERLETLRDAGLEVEEEP